MRKVWIILVMILALVLAALPACRGYTPAPLPATPTPGIATPKATPTPAVTPSPSPVASPPTGVAVTIKDFAFNPNVITIDKGTTVTWTNQDSAPHTVTGQGFDSGQLSQGQSFGFTFSQPGSYNYICSNHPSMKATVEVQ